MKLSEQVAELEEKANKYELMCINLQQDKVDLEAKLAEAQARIREMEGALETIEAWSGNDAYIEIELIKLYAAGQREGSK